MRKIFSSAGSLLLGLAACTFALPGSAAAPGTLYAQWYVPQAQKAVSSAQALHAATQAYCSATEQAAAAQLHQARQQFSSSVQDWERLSAVAMGPMVQLRSARTVDFQPLRLPLLNKAIAKAPQTLTAMEEIGGPAKGFPAIEHLLWTAVAAPQAPACAYAVLSAQSVAHELGLLSQALQKQAEHQPADFFLIEEFLNQWLGGLERLRWQSIDKPLRSASPSKPAQLTRAASRNTLQGWHAQWSGLRSLALHNSTAALRIETLVADKGWENLALRLKTAVQSVDAAMAQIQTIDMSSVQPAIQAMSQLKHLVESEVAPALDVTIGFSDADGD